MSEQKNLIEYKPIHFGKKVRKVLHDRGISHDEFSRAINVSKAHIPRLLNKASFTIERLRAVSKYLGIDLMVYLNSTANLKVLKKGFAFEELQADLVEAQQTKTEQESQIGSLSAEHESLLANQKAAFQTEIDQKNEELAKLEKLLEQEKAARIEAEIQIRILEGKIEVLSQ